jgi:hypothetical protein
MDDKLIVSTTQFTESRKMYLRWRICELISAIFSNLGIITSTIDYETSYASNRTPGNCAEHSDNIFRWLTLALTAVAIAFLYERHKTKTTWKNSKPEEPIYTNEEAVMRRKLSKKKQKRQKKVFSSQFFIELILLLIFPYPHMAGTLTLTTYRVAYNEENHFQTTADLCYTLPELFYTFTFVRLFFLLRALFNFTPYQDDYARYYCARYQTKANVRFSIRCILKTRPFLMIVSVIFPSFFILGIFLRVFERPYDEMSELNFASYLNAVWCCAVTMATIGYGDLYPTTLFGRVVAIICAMWGAFAFSMIVFTLESSLQLSQNKNKAFQAIVRSRAAAKAILAALSYNLAQKRHGSTSRQAKKIKKKMEKKLSKFTSTLKQLTTAMSTIKNDDKNKERFKKLSKHIIRIEDKLDKVLGRYD